MIEFDIQKFVENRDTFNSALSPEITFVFLTLLSDKNYTIAKQYLYTIDPTIDYQAILIYFEKNDWLKIVENGVEMRAKWLQFQPAQSKTKARITEWIDSYCALFEEADKFSSYVVSASSVDCLKKMTKFVSTYRYDKTVILEATKHYMQDMRKDGYRYMRTALSFILHPEKGSLLARYCDAVVKGTTSAANTTKFDQDNVY